MNIICTKRSHHDQTAQTFFIFCGKRTLWM